MTRDVYCVRMGYTDCRAALWAAPALFAFSFCLSCSGVSGASAVDGIQSDLESQCGWVEATPLERQAEPRCLTAWGPAGALPDGVSPCDAEPGKTLLVASWASYGSWHRLLVDEPYGIDSASCPDSGDAGAP